MTEIKRKSRRQLRYEADLKARVESTLKLLKPQPRKNNRRKKLKVAK